MSRAAKSRRDEMPKSWREKFDNPPKDLPKIVRAPPKWERTFGGRKVLIATPLLIDALIRKVKKGKLVTLNQIRERLAKDFKADSTCQITTGIFIRIVSEVAEEDLKMGKKDITPYWRVLREGGYLNEKYPGGVRMQAIRLRKEGHSVQQKGKKLMVKDFEKTLQKL
jgi:alkylated DNA nucleotide flippase Atl1